MILLIIASLVYLLLPTIIFYTVWTEIPVSIFAIAGVSIVFYLSIKCLEDEYKKDFRGFKSLGLNGEIVYKLLIISLFLCLISEFGLSPYKSYDSMIHNYKYHLLSTGKLPLFDQENGLNFCYYFGFYLVPAILGKVFGLAAVKYIVFVWIWIGLFLSFVWMRVYLQLNGIKPAVFKSGLWLVVLVAATSMVTVLPLLQRLTGDTNLANNGISLAGHFVLNQVAIFTRSFSESTQHALPSILGTPMVLVLLRQKNGIFVSALVVGAVLFWSPFAAIGLFPFLAYSAVSALWRKRDIRFFLALLYFAIGLLVAFFPILFFLAGSDSTQMESNKLIWETGADYWYGYYFLYLFAFWGIWFLIVGKSLLSYDKEALVIGTSLVALLGLVQMGYYNDLNIRATLPAALVLGFQIVLVCFNGRRAMGSVRYFVLVLFLGVSSISFLKFYYDRFFVLGIGSAVNSIEAPAVPGSGDNFYEFLSAAYPANGDEVIKQYSLRHNSFFEQHLLKKRK